MRKLLLCVMMLFAFVTVNASTGTTVKNIKIEDVKVEVKENIGYNERLEINYSINPRDAKNLELIWSVSGTKKGVTAEFDNNKSTLSDGSVELVLNNTTDKEVTLIVTAKQNGKVLVSKKIVVEPKDTTLKRVEEEVSTLIKDLDEKITKDNYEENKESIDKITKLLVDNREVKELIDKDLLSKYNTVSQTVADYKETDNTVVTIISIVLVVVFSGLIFWIFKKEEN